MNDIRYWNKRLDTDLKHMTSVEAIDQMLDGMEVFARHCEEKFNIFDADDCFKERVESYMNRVLRRMKDRLNERAWEEEDAE